MNESCQLCESLIKTYFSDDIRFNASCNRERILENGLTRPRLIVEKTGPMVPITPPDWCPKKRGIRRECITNTSSIDRLPVICHQPNPIVKRELTYYEKKELLMKFPKRIEWEDIEEDVIYVIPKILTHSSKVVRIIDKSDTLLRCCEIDEYGNESKTLTTIYPKDVEMVFITKFLKF